MKQKAGTIIFIIITVIGLIITHCIGSRQTSTLPISKTDSALVCMFNDSLINLKKEYESRYASYDSTHSNRHKSRLPQINRHVFNPNTADSIELLELGFKPWQAHNMLKYRARGGKWRKQEDILKIYGVDSAFYAEIQPYIALTDTFAEKGDTAVDVARKYYAEKKDTVIELNTTDTAELKLICYIGDYVANKIIWYRNKLGGYYSVEQIAEIKDLPEGTFDKIKDNLTVNSSLIMKIDINKASVKEMSFHPYIRTEQAQRLYKYRREKMKLKSIDEIREAGIFTENELQRLLPYITLSTNQVN